MKEINPASKFERTRYVLIYFFNKKGINNEDIKSLVLNHVLKVYGIHGSLSMGLFVTNTHNIYPVLLIRVSHYYLTEFYSSLFFIKEITSIPIKTFGSIKKAKEYMNNKNWGKMQDELKY